MKYMLRWFEYVIAILYTCIKYGVSWHLVEKSCTKQSNKCKLFIYNYQLSIINHHTQAL